MDIHVVRLMFLQGNLFSPLRQIESLTSQLLERLLSTVECVESLTFEHYPFVRAPVSEGLKCFKFQVLLLHVATAVNLPLTSQVTLY